MLRRPSSERHDGFETAPQRCQLSSCVSCFIPLRRDVRFYFDNSSNRLSQVKSGGWNSTERRQRWRKRIFNDDIELAAAMPGRVGSVAAAKSINRRKDIR